MRRGPIALVALAVVVTGLVGCSSEEVPAVPDDAVRLVANQPIRLEGLVVTAYHVREDSAKVLVRDGADAESAVVDVGEDGEALGFAFRLVEVEVDTSRGDVPSDRSAAWIVPQSSG